jgi:hypothetical protein
MPTIEITCFQCGMNGAQVRQVRAEGLDLGAERIAVEPDAPCCNTLYIRDLEEALSDLESAVAKRLKNSRYTRDSSSLYQALLFQEAL